ncbi:MAG: dimethyl sulfoxide reductase anchor subunit family protein [Eggerthellaceae bacterium]|jgi:anaerobic dimethyl sulfoxide reductase subunit C (anchor subunit)
MGNGFSELPLAIFTTLAPMGACAFIIIYAALRQLSENEEAVARIDRMTLLPLLVMLVGFVGAFFHLANPMHAVFAVNGIGRSPLTNEVMVGGLFFVAAFVYWLTSRAGKLKANVRNGFLIVLSIWAVVFAAFCGFAYTIDTIPTWNTPWTVIQMIGYGLTGGTVLGLLTLCIADIEVPGKIGKAVFAVGLVGAVLAVLGFGGQIAACASMSNGWGPALDLVPAIGGLFALLAACCVAAVVVEAMARKKLPKTAAVLIVFILVVVGVFFARIGFYGLYMSVAL